MGILVLYAPCFFTEVHGFFLLRAAVEAVSIELLTVAAPFLLCPWEPVELHSCYEDKQHSFLAPAFL